MDRISELATTFLLNAAWQIACIALVAAISSRLMRNVAARYLHALWAISLFLCLALPLWGILNFAKAAERRAATVTVNTTPTDGNRATTSRATPAPESDSAEENGPSIVRVLQRRTHPVATPPALSLALVLGCGLFLLYRSCALWRSWLRARALRKSVDEREIPARMRAVAARCRATLGLRNVPIKFSARVTAPVTLGALKPLIILPESFYSDPPEETLLSVLGHEMAHVVRRDYTFNLVYELLLLPVSFHPFAKFIKRQVDRTREMACDELVTKQLLEPDAYARALVRVASALVTPASRALTLGVFDADVLEERIMLLTHNTRRHGRRIGRLLTLAAFSLLSMSCLAISTFSLTLQTASAFSEADANISITHRVIAEPVSVNPSQHEARAREEQSSSDVAVREVKAQSSDLDGAQERAQAACDAGRRRDVEAIPTLISMLGDDRPIQLLRCWDSGRWSPALETFKEPSPGEQAAIALASMGTPALAPLTHALADMNASVRRNAAWAIGELTNMRSDERGAAVPALISLLSDADEWVRMAAARALGEIRDERAVEKLMNTLFDGGWKVRELAAWALGEMKEERAVSSLCKLLLEDVRAEVRETAAWALGEINDPRAAPVLQQALNDGEPRVRDKARWALSEIEDSDG